MLSIFGVSLVLYQVLRLSNYILSLDYFFFTTIVILTSLILIHPAFQLFLAWKTVAPGENPRLSADCRSVTLFRDESLGRIEPTGTQK
jgi:hypothetical protein